MTTPPLPSPERARDEQLAAARPAITRLREATRAAIARGDGRHEIWVDVPPGTGTVAFDTVRSELEALGWHVRRESSPKNESFMVLAFPESCPRHNAHYPHGTCPGTAPEYPDERVEIVSGDES